MRHGKLIVGLIFGLMVIITLGSLATYRWFKRAFGTAQSTPPPIQSTPSNNKDATTLANASLPIVIKGEVMGHAFRSGQLPAPLPQPQGTPEQAAAELAKRVMAEDEQSTAALLTRSGRAS